MAKSIVCVIIALLIGAAGFWLGARGRGAAEEKARSALEDLRAAKSRNSKIAAELERANETTLAIAAELERERAAIERIETINRRLEEENIRQREIIGELTAGTGKDQGAVERIGSLAEEGGEIVDGLLELLAD